MKDTHISNIVGVPTRIVYTFIKQFIEGGTYKGNTSIGSISLMGEIFVEFYYFQELIVTHCQLLLQDIIGDCLTKLSTRTICRSLHNHDIFNRIAMKKPFLTPLHMSQQLDFAR